MAYEYQSFATLGVNLNRQNYGALDISQVFNSDGDLKFYLSKGADKSSVSDYWKDVIPYPYHGQLISTTFGSHTTVSVLEPDGDRYKATELAKQSEVDELSSNLGAVERALLGQSGDFSLESINVAGTSTFVDINAHNVALSGDLSVTGNLKINGITASDSTQFSIGGASTISLHTNEVRFESSEEDFTAYFGTDSSIHVANISSENGTQESIPVNITSGINTPSIVNGEDSVFFEYGIQTNIVKSFMGGPLQLYFDTVQFLSGNNVKVQANGDIEAQHFTNYGGGAASFPDGIDVNSVTGFPELDSVHMEAYTNKQSNHIITAAFVHEMLDSIIIDGGNAAYADPDNASLMQY